MDSNLSALLRLNRFSTGRRLYAYHRVLAIVTKMPEVAARPIEDLVKEATTADQETYALEERWATQRRTGKLSAKQQKAQRALQKIDGQLDRAISGLRDGAMALVKGADEEEEALVAEVESFLHEILPNGVHAVTSLGYAEELVAVQWIVKKLEDPNGLAPVVAQLGLSVNVERLAKVAKKYDEAQMGADTLEFGALRAAREKGQDFLLRITAKILGTFDAPSGEVANKRATLLTPILTQNEAISDHARARRNIPDVNPETGEEDPVEADAGAAAEAPPV